MTDPGDRRHEKDRGGGRRARSKRCCRSRPRPSARRSPASELVLALQCGGSDGYSGMTANAALGAAVDLLVRQGGTAILSETPEIYGAEHLLTRRAATRAIGEKLVERIQWWEDYTSRNRRRDEQQSLARQQGRRAHHHSREIARRGGEGRHDRR